MINGISGVSHMTGVLAVQPYRGTQNYRGYTQVKALSQSSVGQSSMPAAAGQGRQSTNALPASGIQPAQKIGAVYAGRGANPGIPVEPVDPVRAVTSQGTRGIAYAVPFLRKGMDPAELAVRMRMKYADTAEGKAASGLAGADAPGTGSARKTAGIQEASGEKECQTCKERKYQDGSDDAGVSYQTPAHIAPEQAASAVRGHEMEHVVRERASAEREDRRVVSQSVTMHTAICPECGRVYVSGGTTRTTTAADTQPEWPAADQNAEKAPGMAA